MGQISTKYFFKLYRQKIFAASFESYIQLVLKTSFTSFLQPAWIETGSVVNPSSALDCVQLDPNIIQKWNCTAGNLQIFLSEIIELQENGSRGRYLAWISNFHFYMGIAA